MQDPTETILALPLSSSEPNLPDLWILEGGLEDLLLQLDTVEFFAEEQPEIDGPVVGRKLQ